MTAPRLAPLAAVERLSPACIRILGGNPGKFTLQGTNTYLLGTGRQRILIDTGEGRPAWVASLQETLREEKAGIKAALISHWHRDHTGGIDHLLRIAPEAVVYKNDPGPGQSPIHDGQKFYAEGVTLTATHTPGHTRDHTVFVLHEEDAMLTADNVLGHGTAVFEDLAAYLESLDKMSGLFGGRAYPGHGPVVEDGPGKIVDYIAHRRQREEQVLHTMGASYNPEAETKTAWRAMDLVKSIYSDVPDELHEAARGGVMQILVKLEREGRVTRECQDEWRLLRHDATS
ncbi:metallo-beta-lactamase superfamily protein [Hirsutella rhossiliensis]|uniref:Metallo-beta-lactamase superfamily domain-containing protein n=1 Tax=Hirsutella rhossiliensis TaxID=111463 RepID=A0A9P8SFI8_9HYPO|nr:metallo-beta-lactamase superfamily domain-containing protein [Hirsutella rhossiliensis]KAH0960079.1 metallo-beta-lactamase superfamily domain-containing protein [Hirsutella rhossiliensis]